MRTENTNLFDKISNDHMNNLVKEVTETVAIEMNNDNSKNIFSAANLWNIQKMRKTNRTAYRRFAF